MTSPSTDRRLGLLGSTGFKAPVTVLAAANVTQYGEQTIDGKALLAVNADGVPDRVVCVGQTDATQNGIWDVSTAAWTRSLDSNQNYDLKKGTTVIVTDGTTYAGTYWQITSANPITLGTTSIAWARALASSITTLSFLQAGTGAVSRGAQDKMRVRVDASDFMTGAQQLDVASYGGTLDVTAAIQAALDYVLYTLGGGVVYLSAGRHKITDTLHVGYGVTYNGTPYTSGVLEGASGGFDVFGTLVVPTFRDRPAVALSGARGSDVRRISFLGDRSYMLTQNLDYPAGQVDNYVAHPGNAAADTPATWVNPAWPASASSRYAPFCAIAVDPYAGAAPATAYPNVTYPAFLGVVAQYNKAASSNTNFEELFVQGFTAGIVHSPSGSSSQDDFSRVKKCWIEYCVYGVSVGHTDARLMSVEDCNIPNCHTALAGDVHGQQLGQFGSAITNVGFDRCVNWLSLADVANERGGSMTFLNCYGENAWRIGNYGTATGVSGNGTLILENCHPIFSYGSALGRPANVIKMNDNTGLKILGGELQNVDSPFSVKGKASNAQIDCAFSVLTPTGLNPYEKYARTGAPMTFTNSFEGMPDFAGRWVGYDAQTGSQNGRNCRARGVLSDKGNPAPIYASMLWPSGARATALGSQKGVQNPGAGQLLTKSGLSGLSLSGLDLTLTFAARTEAEYITRGPMPGDVIVDSTTGAVFYVYNRTALVVKAKLQNNYRPNGGGYSYAEAMTMNTASAEQLTVFNTRLFSPKYYARGTLTAASNIITNVASDDGSLVSIQTDIPVGSAIFVDSYEDAITAIAGSEPIITAVSDGAQTITLTGNAAKSVTAKQMGLFVLAPVANI